MPPEARKARYLAKKLGCDLSYHRGRCHVVDIDLPDGMKMAGTRDVDSLHHECELHEDIWPGVIQELETLEIEPLDARYR
jgi:hypothetical protein